MLLIAFFLVWIRKFELLLCPSSLGMVPQLLSTCNNQPILRDGSQSKLLNLMMFTGPSFPHHLCEDGYLSWWL